MHGMICKALEGFLVAAHGERVWRGVRLAARLGEDGFEPLDVYPDDTFRAALAAAAHGLDRPEEVVLEDVGTWLCTHPPLEPVRRLFRFCGTSFLSFLFSLEEVQARGRMALPRLELPSCRVRPEPGGRCFRLHATWSVPGAGSLAAGLLRAMASDHGTLAVIEPGTSIPAPEGWRQVVTVDLVRETFHAPKAFELARPP